MRPSVERKRARAFRTEEMDDLLLHGCCRSGSSVNGSVLDRNCVKRPVFFKVDHDLIQDQSGIDRIDSQSVMSGGNHVLGNAYGLVSKHILFPLIVPVLSPDGTGLQRIVVKTYGISQIALPVGGMRRQEI